MAGFDYRKRPGTRYRKAGEWAIADGELVGFGAPAGDACNGH
ncbi:hypothetical protein MMMB2_1337 [Mycobacterium marinum MB2]|nr:hypothetical protein MMMB2_1337 [Mycobacterium marinum MB2]